MLTATFDEQNRLANLEVKLMSGEDTSGEDTPVESWDLDAVAAHAWRVTSPLLAIEQREQSTPAD